MSDFKTQQEYFIATCSNEAFPTRKQAESYSDEWHRVERSCIKLPVIHVIYYTAYEALQAENEGLKDLLSGQVHTCSKYCKLPMCVQRRELDATKSALEVAEGSLKDAIDKAVSGHWNDLDAVLTNALDQIAKIKEGL